MTHSHTLVPRNVGPMIMRSIDEMIFNAILKQPGTTDRWLAEAVYGPGTQQQRVNGYCRDLAATGRILRKLRPDGLIGNFVVAECPIRPNVVLAASTAEANQAQQLGEKFLSE